MSVRFFYSWQIGFLIEFAEQFTGRKFICVNLPFICIQILFPFNIDQTKPKTLN